MDKIYQRAEAVTRNLTRRKQRSKVHFDNTKARESRRRVQQWRSAQNNLKKAARLRQREDWELGPLAPRRDVGTLGYKQWGTAPEPAVMGDEEMELPPWEQVWMPIAVGDRVVIIRGHDKGKIGVVINASKKGQTVKLDGLFKVYAIEYPCTIQHKNANTLVVRDISAKMDARV
jgi:large subunit ribosomal protein L24